MSFAVTKPDGGVVNASAVTDTSGRAVYKLRRLLALTKFESMPPAAGRPLKRLPVLPCSKGKIPTHDRDQREGLVDYVFLLDPWWNPAVEAQAIDRVHRIGQKRAVNAYRFIAKNTVEEKILELQKTKKGVSAEIFGQKTNLIRNLTAMDS